MALSLLFYPVLRGQVAVEERQLRQRHQGEYDKYLARVSTPLVPFFADAVIVEDFQEEKPSDS